MRIPAAKAVGMRGYGTRDARHAGGLGAEPCVEENRLWARAASHGMLAPDCVRLFRSLFAAHGENTHPMGEHVNHEPVIVGLCSWFPQQTVECR